MFRTLGGALNGNIGVMRTMVSEIVKEKKYALFLTASELHADAEADINLELSSSSQCVSTSAL